MKLFVSLAFSVILCLGCEIRQQPSGSPPLRPQTLFTPMANAEPEPEMSAADKEALALIPKASELTIEPEILRIGGLRLGDLATTEWLTRRTIIKDKDIPNFYYVKETITTENGEILISYTFEKKVLIGITLFYDSKCFDDLYHIYIKKLGMPSEEENEIKSNAFGMTFNNEVKYWKTVDGVFVLEKHGTNAVKGTGYISSPRKKLLEQQRKERNQSKLEDKL